MWRALTSTAVLACTLCWLPSQAHAAPQAEPVAAPAQTTPAETLPTQPFVLQPFVATYQVFHQGRALGEATMQLRDNGNGHWRIDLTMKGSGLMRLTGLNLQQSTAFEVIGDRYRPLGQSMVKRAFLSSRKTTGSYDWNARQARWTGDVKQSRRAPVPLQDGDMSGLLINLAVIRDAQPGKTLHYRFVDDGRARDHIYQAAQAPEPMQAGDVSYDALRVARSNGGNDETVIWVASGVPTPIRILQREDGSDATDLRLIQYR